MKGGTRITLRKIVPADTDFLREVYAAARAYELTMVPWSPEQREAFLRFQFDAQDADYHERYPGADYQIILNQGTPVGRLYVSRGEDEIKILDVTVLLEHRKQGIGTTLIRQLLDEANRRQRPISVWVEQFNPSRQLFERLGFDTKEDDGFNYLMEYKPETEPLAAPG